jgi:hypothetical protein
MVSQDFASGDGGSETKLRGALLSVPTKAIRPTWPSRRYQDSNTMT